MLYLQRKTIKNSLIAVCCSLFLTFGLQAQTPVNPEQQGADQNFSDNELKQFANAAGKVVVIQQETEQKMIKVIEEEDLEVQKFNEIMEAQQNQQTADIDASKEDLEKFDKAAGKIIQIQTEVQGEMIKAIEEEGLKPEKYEQILLAYQSNPQVRNKVNALIQE